MDTLQYNMKSLGVVGGIAVLNLVINGYPSIRKFMKSLGVVGEF